MERPIFLCMRTALLVLLVVAVAGTVVYAQPLDTLWTQTFGGRYYDGCTSVQSVQNTDDGGYIIGGWTMSFGSGYEDMYLVKADSMGNLLWEQVYGGNLYDRCNALQQTADGGFILAGYTTSYGAGGQDMYLVKTDGQGNFQWQQTYGGSGWDACYSVQQTADGGYILAGNTNSFGAGSYDMYLVKTDAAGNLEWEQTFGGSAEDYCNAVQQTNDGGYILGGWTLSFGAGISDMYVVKTDALGNQEWYRTYGGSDYDKCLSLQQIITGGYILAGETMSYGAGVSDMYLVKTEANGDTVWTRTFGGPYNDVCMSVQECADGGYIMGGYTTSFGAGDNDFYLVKSDHSCDMEWEMTLGGSDFDQCYTVRQTSDYGFIVGGVTESFGAGYLDMYLVRLGPEACTIAGSVSPPYSGVTVYILSENEVLVASDSVITEDGSYSFGGLYPGTYSVHIIEPLGYEVDQNNVVVTMPGGWESTVDFNLSPIVRFNDARTMDYWRHEIVSNYYGIGYHHYDTSELLAFFQDIFDHFYLNPVNPIQIEGVTYTGDPAAAPLSMEALVDMLTTDSDTTFYWSACHQYVALLLNVVSDKVGQYFEASDDGATISQAIVYINELLGSDDQAAMTIAKTLNEGLTVAAGTIPLTTPDVIFSTEMEASLQSDAPYVFSLNPAAPNPFNPSTTLSFTLPEAARTILSVYDVSGRLVTTLVNGWQDVGHHEVIFDASDLASGMYIYRLSAGKYEACGKMIMLK